jgi:hypothetical protein
LKLAQLPQLVSPFFNLEMLRDKSEQEYKKELESEESEFAMYSSEDLK